MLACFLPFAWWKTGFGDQGRRRETASGVQSYWSVVPYLPELSTSNDLDLTLQE